MIRGRLSTLVCPDCYVWWLEKALRVKGRGRGEIEGVPRTKAATAAARLSEAARG